MIRFLCKLGVVCLKGLVPFVSPKVQTILSEPTLFFSVLFPSGAPVALLDSLLQNGCSRTVSEKPASFVSSLPPVIPHRWGRRRLSPILRARPLAEPVQTQWEARALRRLEAALAAVPGPRCSPPGEV